MIAFLSAILLVSLPSSGAGSLPMPSEECYEDTFCVETVETEYGVALSVRLLVQWDITVAIDMELANLRSSEELPIIRSFSGGSRSDLVELRVVRAGHRWEYAFNFRWVEGSMAARHAPGVTYALPYARGSSYLVGQGYNGNRTHQGKNAIDWDMEEGTEVLAARGGLVISVEESFSDGGMDPSFRTLANYVKIRHDDGTIGNYVHLRRNGARVYAGDRVREGDHIGWSGNTGYSSGPHLHFEVYSVNDELERITIPVEFRTRGRSAELLVEGRTYSH